MAGVAVLICLFLEYCVLAESNFPFDARGVRIVAFSLIIYSKAQTQLNLSLSFTHSVGRSISRRNILQIILEGGVKSWQKL